MDLGGFASGVSNFTQSKAGQMVAAGAQGFTGSYDSKAMGAVLGVAKMVPIYGQALALVEGIIGKETINKTLGAVFANGFNFKCWGASWTPQTADNRLPHDSDLVQQAAKKAMNVTPDQFERSVNKFYEDYYYGRGGMNQYAEYDRAYMLKGAKDCTLKGLQKYFAGSDAIKDECTKAFTKACQEVGLKFIEMPKRKITLKGPQSVELEIENIKILFPDPVQPEKKVEVVTNADGTTSIVPEKSSMGFLGIALIGGAIFYGMKKFKK